MEWEKVVISKLWNWLINGLMQHETILIVGIIFVWCTGRKQFTNSMWALYHLGSFKNFDDFICWTVLGESCTNFFCYIFCPLFHPKHIQATLFSQRIIMSLLLVFLIFKQNLPFNSCWYKSADIFLCVWWQCAFWFCFF